MEQSQFKRRTPEEWIKLFREKHGDDLIYFPETFGNSRKKIKVECPTHGEFWQNPTDHLLNKGCGKCNYSHAASFRKNSPETWLKFFKKVHGDRYDYSKSIFVEAHTPIEIICNEHGLFSQIPNDHKYGKGCPKCGSGIRHDRFKWEEKMKGREVRFYLLKCYDDQEVFYKIGTTSTELNRRFGGKKLPYNYDSLLEFKSFDTTLIREIEDEVADKFSSCKYIPTKSFNGYRECLSEIDLDWVNKFLKDKTSVVC